MLQAAFVTPFGRRFGLGALASLPVTVSSVSIGRIGAALRGPDAGALVSLRMELEFAEGRARASGPAAGRNAQ